MTKINYITVKAIIHIVIGLAYSPVFLLAYALNWVSRLVLSISYFGMLNGVMGKCVFKSLFMYRK